LKWSPRRSRTAGHRVKAKRADSLAAHLVTAEAALTGKLADPTDLPFTEDLLDDDGLVDDGLVDDTKVQAAVDDLIKRKPHLAARRPTGDVGQGARPEVPEVGLGAAAPWRLSGRNPPGCGTSPSPRYESEDAHMSTRTMAIVALVIAVLLLFFFVILPRI
jgi:hypothetical protein